MGGSKRRQSCMHSGFKDLWQRNFHLQNFPWNLEVNSDPPKCCPSCFCAPELRGVRKTCQNLTRAWIWPCFENHRDVENRRAWYPWLFQGEPSPTNWRNFDGWVRHLRNSCTRTHAGSTSWHPEFQSAQAISQPCTEPVLQSDRCKSTQFLGCAVPAPKSLWMLGSCKTTHDGWCQSITEWLSALGTETETASTRRSSMIWSCFRTWSETERWRLQDTPQTNAIIYLAAACSTFEVMTVLGKIFTWQAIVDSWKILNSSLWQHLFILNDSDLLAVPEEILILFKKPLPRRLAACQPRTHNAFTCEKFLQERKSCQNANDQHRNDCGRETDLHCKTQFSCQRCWNLEESHSYIQWNKKKSLLLFLHFATSDSRLFRSTQTQKISRIHLEILFSKRDPVKARTFSARCRHSSFLVDPNVSWSKFSIWDWIQNTFLASTTWCMMTLTQLHIFHSIHQQSQWGLHTGKNWIC